MLTSADGLFTPGKQWPPKCETGRLADVRDFFTLYGGQRDFSLMQGTRASQIFKAAFERVVRDDYSAHMVTVNLFRVAVQTPCDLLYGEENELRSVPDGTADPAHEWAEREKLWTQAYEATCDAMVSGDSYFRIVPDGNEARLSVIAPDIAFPIVQPDDVRKATGYVVAWKWNEGEAHSPDWKGIAEEHWQGGYRRLSLTFDRPGERITSVVEEQRFATGLPGLAIVHLASPNRRTNAFHGTSELADIDSLVAEIEVRIEQASRVLDKHSDPSINAPESAFTLNPVTGSWELKAGSAFLLEPGDEKAEYMTWNADMKATFQMHDTLMAHWHVLTCIPASLFDNTGGVTSGTAYKRMMMPLLAKVARWREAVEDALEEVVMCAGVIERFDTSDLTFDWSDGLPNDPLETAQTVALQRTAGVQSVGSAVAQITGESGPTVQDEVDAIAAEKASVLPTSQAPRIQLQTLNQS